MLIAVFGLIYIFVAFVLGDMFDVLGSLDVLEGDTGGGYFPLITFGLTFFALFGLLSMLLGASALLSLLFGFVGGAAVFFMFLVVVRSIMRHQSSTVMTDEALVRSRGEWILTLEAEPGAYLGLVDVDIRGMRERVRATSYEEVREGEAVEVLAASGRDIIVKPARKEQ